jgi:aminoglycoside phosphotransferase (APT) family kinase protein
MKAQAIAHSAVRELLARRVISISNSKSYSFRIECLGAGLFRRGYLVTFADQIRELPQSFVALIPNDKVDPDIYKAWEREISVLKFLETERFAPAFPRLIDVVRQDALPILFTELVPGFPLDNKFLKIKADERIEAVAVVAHTIHSLSRDRFAELLPGAGTWREFAEAMISKYRSHTDPDIASAVSWCDRYLPGDEATVVLHGDLMPQNIFMSLARHPNFSAIDWSEASLGDPAYEFAVVTRGVRRPFKVNEGLPRLLKRYAELSGRDIEPARVRFYEVILIVGWLAHHLEHDPSSGLVQAERHRLRGLIA